MVSKGVIFGAFLLLVSSNFLYLGAFLMKQLFHLRLLDMRLVIANLTCDQASLFFFRGGKEPSRRENKGTPDRRL